jgi:hypothetical protein
MYSTIELDELQFEERRLWSIVGERKEALRVAEANWYAVHRQIKDAEEERRINDLVESRLQKKEKVNVKAK